MTNWSKLIGADEGPPEFFPLQTPDCKKKIKANIRHRLNDLIGGSTTIRVKLGYGERGFNTFVHKTSLLSEFTVGGGNNHNFCITQDTCVQLVNEYKHDGLRFIRVMLPNDSEIERLSCPIDFSDSFKYKETNGWKTVGWYDMDFFPPKGATRTNTDVASIVAVYTPTVKRVVKTLDGKLWIVKEDLVKFKSTNGITRIGLGLVVEPEPIEEADLVSQIVTGQRLKLCDKKCDRTYLARPELKGFEGWSWLNANWDFMHEDK